MPLKNRLMIAAVGLATLFVIASFARAQEQVVDKKGRVVTKVTFIHFKKEPGKPAGGGGGGKTDSGYYTYIAKGAKWRVAEDVYLNTLNGESATTAPADVVKGAATLAMNEWETPGTATLNIFKNTLVGTVGPKGEPIAYNNGAHRDYNTISFGDYSGGGNVIAVTTVWGVFGGPVNQREITEAHILLNDVYTWGDATRDVDGDGSPDYVMDVQNILTHELGHWVGMGDLYQGGAIEETMYGYSTVGETKKRDLYKGDIAGVTKLY
jgi:hypothetical protein